MKMTEAQRKVLAWMADGDRALHKAHWDENRYGGYSRGALHQRICSRRTVEILIAAGYAEWMKDSPPDLRAMITRAGRAALGER